MTVLPTRAALTRSDLQTLPVDGLRYELLDGSLIVTPAPSVRHQAAVTQLVGAVLASCPDHLFVLTAPTDLPLAEDTILQPDLLVVERSSLLGPELSPLLVIEVLSPTTRRIDLTLKKSRYEAAGTPSYWVVDVAEPSITAWELVDGVYADPVVATGADALPVTSPFSVTLTPSQLTI